MAEVFFFIAAIGAILGALGTVVQSNPFYSVLSLVSHLLCLAALFLLLRAEMLAAAQVVVYAGAVMVLYVFVVAYVGNSNGVDALRKGDPSLGLASVVFGGLLLAELLIAIIGSGLKSIDAEGSGFIAGFGQPAVIGELLLTKFLYAFEVASILLLMAAVGSVILARRRSGLEGGNDISVGELLRNDPQSLLDGSTAGDTERGTLAEALGPKGS